MLKKIVFAVALAASFPNQVHSAQLLSTARQYIGLHEKTHNKKLRQTLGVNPASVKWCGYFVTAIAKKVGIKPPLGSGRAISWKSIGKPVAVSMARPGDIVVMINHVTIYSGRKGGKVCGIGGNQSNRVKESCYSTKKILAVRRLQ